MHQTKVTLLYNYFTQRLFCLCFECLSKMLHFTDVNNVFCYTYFVLNLSHHCFA